MDTDSPGDTAFSHRHQLHYRTKIEITEDTRGQTQESCVCVRHSRAVEIPKNWFSKATKTRHWERCVKDASHAAVLGQL